MTVSKNKSTEIIFYRITTIGHVIDMTMSRVNMIERNKCCSIFIAKYIDLVDYRHCCVYTQLYSKYMFCLSTNVFY